jgi:hypothetical protein
MQHGALAPVVNHEILNMSTQASDVRYRVPSIERSTMATRGISLAKITQDVNVNIHQGGYSSFVLIFAFMYSYQRSQLQKASTNRMY